METDNKPLPIRLWQKSVWSKLAVAVVGFFIVFTVIGLVSPRGQQSFKEGEKDGSSMVNQNPLSPTPTSTPGAGTSPALSMTPEETFSEIAREKAGGKYASVQALKQEDGYWVVTAVVNSWPELFASNTVKLWAFNFISGVYHTDYPIKQAGITINSPISEGKFFRVFLGLNQSGVLTEDDWKAFSQSTFYDWLKSVQTNRNETDRANRTFLEENL